MVEMATLHALAAEFHGGILLLAFVAIILTAAAQIVVHFKSNMPKTLVGWAMRARGYLDATGFVAAVAGIPAILFSAYTGSQAWDIDALVDNVIIRNKIELTVFALVLWIGVVAIRWRFGRPLWTCPTLGAFYVLLSIGAMSVTGVAGSLGAHLTLGESILDPVWNLIHIDVTKDLLLDQTLALAIAIVSILVLLGVLLVARISGISKEQLGPRKCSNWSKWDEPTIQEPKLKS